MATTALRRDFEKNQARPEFKLDTVREEPILVGLKYICTNQKELPTARVVMDDDVAAIIAKRIVIVMREREDAIQHVACELCWETSQHRLGTLEQIHGDAGSAPLGIVRVTLQQSEGKWRSMKARISSSGERQSRYVSAQSFEVKWYRRPPAKALVGAASSANDCCGCTIL